MANRFHFSIEIPHTVYTLDRESCVKLLAALDALPEGSGDAARRLRDDLRLALAVDALPEARVSKDEEVERVTANLAPKSGTGVRCSWCGEEGERLPTEPGESEPLYVCRTPGCHSNGQASTEKVFTTGYR